MTLRAEPEAHVTVSRLQKRRVLLTWQEVVAITVEVGEAFERSGLRAVPGPEMLELLPDGTIQFLKGRCPSTDPVSALAAILNDLLTHDSPPQLRLLLSTAGPGGSSCESVPELLEALRYFDRPGRAEILADIYQRGLTAPAVPEHEPSADSTEPDLAGDQGTKRKPRRLRWVAVAAAVVVATTVGLLAVDAMRPGTVGEGVVSLRQTMHTAQAAVQQGARELQTSASKDLASIVERLERSNLGMALGSRDASASGQDVETNAPADQSGPVGANRSRRRPEPAAAVEEKPDQIDLEQVPQEPILFVGERGHGELPRGQSEDAGGGPPDDVQPVFDARYEDVMPPQPLSLTLPTEDGAASRGGTLGVVEALVSRSGDVERVKLVSVANVVHEGMLLSAVKTWRFTPAFKDGEPVRYRHLITVRR